METKVIEVAGKKIIVGIDTDGQIISQYYREDPAPDPPVKTKTPPAEIRDKVSLSNWIVGQGYKRGTPEFDEMYKSYKGDMPLESHPVKDTR